MDNTRDTYLRHGINRKKRKKGIGRSHHRTCIIHKFFTNFMSFIYICYVYSSHKLRKSQWSLNVLVTVYTRVIVSGIQ